MREPSSQAPPTELGPVGAVVFRVPPRMPHRIPEETLFSPRQHLEVLTFMVAGRERAFRLLDVGCLTPTFSLAPRPARWGQRADSLSLAVKLARQGCYPCQCLSLLLWEVM